MFRELTLEDAIDLVEGAKILGTGGGGDPSLALERINDTYSAGKHFRIQEITEFKPNDMICIIGMVGGGVSSKDKRYIEKLSPFPDNAMLEAVKLLEKHLGVSFAGFISTEMGPGNIVAPMWVGSLLDRTTVDGDMCGGRSKPMISISTTTVAGVSITPLAVASVYGDRLILKNTVSDKRAEDICRALARLSDGTIAVARCPMTAASCRKAVVSGTISLSIQLGNKIRKRNGSDPLPIIEKVLNAHLIFTGNVKEFKRTESKGFTSGTITIRSKNHLLEIWYQNEYLLSWLDGKRYVTCPDSILVVDRKTGKGLTPWIDDFQEDREVAVLVRPSAEIWKTKRGLEIFGPQVFHPGWRYQSH